MKQFDKKHRLDFHGGVYFIRRGDLCNKIYDTCMEIKANYYNYRFAYFKKPADEPIIALAMAIHNCKPVTLHPECCAYFPSIHKTLVTDYFKNKCEITVDGKREKALLVHYATRHTTLPVYTIAKKMVLFQHKNKRSWNAAETIYYKALCYLQFVFIGLIRFNYPKRVIHHIKKRFFSKQMNAATANAVAAFLSKQGVYPFFLFTRIFLNVQINVSSFLLQNIKLEIKLTTKEMAKQTTPATIQPVQDAIEKKRSTY